ncbi:MAG: sugar ABC transporter ATP-binding protein [Bacillota bacterium]
MAHDSLLELLNICKEYYGNQVLKNVSLSVHKGEIHGLVGENGAGKSTLMNILFGMPVIHQTGGYEGKIFLEEKPVYFQNPAQAMESGIGMVHQEFMLIPGFNVAENIKLNRERTRANWASKVFGQKLKTIDTQKNRQDARKALDRLGMSFDETAPVGGLPVGYMQFIEVAREIDKENTRVVVFDEPTAVLTESEAEKFLLIAQKLAGEGMGVLFISHRLDEITQICDRITVLRDGEVVASLKRHEATVEKIAELMVGRKVSRIAAETKITTVKKPVLELHNLFVEMPGERVRDLSIDVLQGEILGIGGLAGHGKIGIANGIMGMSPARGAVLKDGKSLPLGDTMLMLKEGMAFVSEDRRGVGLLWDESIEQNIVAAAIQSQNKFLKKILPFIALEDRATIKQHTLKMIEELDIRCLGPHQPVRRLSGGNQQKVCIARAITLLPDILFVSEPTRGIDIGAKRIVLELLLKLNRELGVTIVMISSELAELRSICDRIAIIYQGRLEGILAPTAADLEFGLMMAGEYEHREATQA